MFKKLYSRMYYAFTRFLLSILLIPSEAKLKKKNVHQDVKNLMEKIEIALIKGDYLRKDLTKGQMEGPTKSSRILINAYTSNREMLEINEPDFYLQVAKDWASVLFKRRHRRSLICIIVFLVTYLSAFVLHEYISGWIGALWLMILFFSPILGILSVVLGKGWKKWLLILVNIFLLIVFFMIVS